jgi:hypothetical protein
VRLPPYLVFIGEGAEVGLTICAKDCQSTAARAGLHGTSTLNRLLQWRYRLADWTSDNRVQFGNAMRGLSSLASRRNAVFLALSALPLLLAIALLPVPPGSSWARLAERAAWQWTVLQNTPESYEWFY